MQGRPKRKEYYQNSNVTHILRLIVHNTEALGTRLSSFYIPVNFKHPLT